MSRRLGAMAGGLLLGVALGVIITPNEIPETKIVTVKLPPKVYTKKVVEQVPVQTELPDECRSFLKRQKDLINDQFAIQRQIQAITDRLVNEPVTSQTQFWIYKKNRKLMLKQVSVAEELETIEALMNICVKQW